jgi:methylmalonyl-CoA mutase N-terminal domain/subunit
LHCCCVALWPQAIALPIDFSAKLARNTQLILAEETGVRRVADPLGGSFYLEALTTQARRGTRCCIAADTCILRRTCTASG